MNGVWPSVKCFACLPGHSYCGLATISGLMGRQCSLLKQQIEKGSQHTWAQERLPVCGVAGYQQLPEQPHAYTTGLNNSKLSNSKSGCLNGSETVYEIEPNQNLESDSRLEILFMC